MRTILALLVFVLGCGSSGTGRTDGGGDEIWRDSGADAADADQGGDGPAFCRPRGGCFCEADWEFCDEVQPAHHIRDYGECLAFIGGGSMGHVSCRWLCLPATADLSAYQREDTCDTTPAACNPDEPGFCPPSCEGGLGGSLGARCVCALDRATCTGMQTPMRDGGTQYITDPAECRAQGRRFDPDLSCEVNCVSGQRDAGPQPCSPESRCWPDGPWDCR